MSVGISTYVRRNGSRQAAAIHQRAGPGDLTKCGDLVSPRSMGQRIRPQLKLVDLARCPFSSFHVVRGSRAERCPEPSPLPAGLGIVDAAVEPLYVEPERIRHARHDPLA